MKFSYEDPENQEEKVYEELGVTKDDCLGAFFFNKIEGLMFEYEWGSEEGAADIGKIISSNNFLNFYTPNSNILTLTIPSAKMPELTDPVECPSCPYTLQPDYQGKNFTL